MNDQQSFTIQSSDVKRGQNLEAETEAEARALRPNFTFLIQSGVLTGNTTLGGNSDKVTKIGNIYKFSLSPEQQQMASKFQRQIRYFRPRRAR